MSESDVPLPGRFTRRAVLLGGAAALGATALGGSAVANALAMPGAGLRKLADPFTLGVASGDPLPDGVVLWTRLATDPTHDDGLGGMPDKVVPVQWEVATDEKFSDVVQSGEAEAAPDLAHSVHVELEGLQPGAEYFYRFKAQDAISPVGRTRTAPAAGSLGELTMCFASCAHYGAGYFTAYRRMAEDEPHLILHLGDYQYEYAAEDDDVREVLGPETRTLAHYRQRHAQYKTDPDLQLAHATAPWVVVWDDHETENNWADETPEKPDDGFLDRREAAFRAYYENMPLRSGSKPDGIDLQLYRRLSWGSLVNFHMLDTRQYRSDQVCGDGVQSGCDDREDPKRSLTGAEQEQWLIDGFNSTSARWDVLGQQVVFSKLDLTPGSEEGYNMDAWDGYVANRDRIADAMADSKVRNGVVLTGDVHRHWAAEIKRTHDDPDSRPVGTELVTTSVTSGGDGSDDTNDDVLSENPHVKFYADRRGYVRTKFTGTQLTADYRVLPKVSEKDAPASTAQSFVIEDGNPTLNPT